MAIARTSLLAAVAALAMVAGPGAARAVPSGAPIGPAAARILDIEGNLVLVDEVYEAVVDLPASARATPELAAEVGRRILDFLRRAGYALAQVEAQVIDGRIRVTVDEGRLARVVIRGRDVISSLTIRLKINLPFDVLNKPQLERMLRPFQRGDVAVRYALVPTKRVEDEGLQIDPLALLPGAAPLPASEAAYELHIDFSGGSPRGSLSLVAGIDPDSMRAGGELKGYSALFADDRWELEAQVGANYLEDIRRETSELKFSRVFADASWLAPAFVRGTLRPKLRLREDLIRRQRTDLLVESYWWNRLEGAAGLALEPRKGLELAFEVGLQQRDLFAISQLASEEPQPSLGSRSTLTWFTALVGKLIFDPERLRADRRHRLLFEARQSVGTDGKPFWLVDAGYRRVFELGWNELWLRGSLGGVEGSYEIADAIPMHYLRGVFGNDYYLDRAAAAVVEYRLSLQRDTFKIGFFNEAAVVREADGSPAAGQVRVGDSFGPSFHALVLDVFQLDLSYAFGFLDDGSFDYGISLGLAKAF